MARNPNRGRREFLFALLRGKATGYLGAISLWPPVVVWAGLILVATSAPGDNEPLLKIPHSDLAAHAAVYGILGFLLHRAVFSGTRFGAAGKAWLVALAAGLLFGILDEVHQIPIATRHFEFTDILADAVGVALGVYVFLRWGVRDVVGSVETPGEGPKTEP